MWDDEAFERRRRSWPRRIARFAIGMILVCGLGTATYFLIIGMAKTEKKVVRMMTRITLPPPTPPPPPKPPVPQKTAETPKLQEPRIADKQPDKAPPKPQQPKPAVAPLTAEAGTGSNPYGLGVGDGSGNVIGGGEGGGEKGSYRIYSRIVSADVQSALKREDKLRFARFVADLRIWLDHAGRVTRVQMMGTSGDPAIDAAVARSVSGLAMREPPPKDMPQPILLRTKAEPG